MRFHPNNSRGRQPENESYNIGSSRGGGPSGNVIDTIDFGFGQLNVGRIRVLFDVFLIGSF